MADEVLTSRDGAVLTITLNRPDVYNAINRAMHDGLAAALAEAADPGDSRGRAHGRRSRLLRRPGSPRVPGAPGRRPRGARADVPPEHPRDPRAREAGDRGDQRRRAPAPGSRSRARATSASRSSDATLRARLHRDRPRPRRRRHVVHPPPARLRARVRVDGLEPAPERRRGARLGTRLRGGPRPTSSPTRVAELAELVRGAADARGRDDEAALRARVHGVARGAARARGGAPAGRDGDGGLRRGRAGVPREAPRRTSRAADVRGARPV